MADTVVVRMNLPWDMTFDLDGKSVLINGAKKQEGNQKIMLPAGEYGSTTIPKEDWEAIKKKYGSMDLFKRELIFAMSNRASADDKAEDLKEKRHGLEQEEQMKDKKAKKAK